MIEQCNRVLNFWKMEEYFSPLDYPELKLKIKQGEKEVPFDAYYTGYNSRELPLYEYEKRNEYLCSIDALEDKYYNRANIYCGRYKLKSFVEKMAQYCNLDMDKYEEIHQLSGRFYIFSVQIDLQGKITEEGIQISPFFYAVICMMKTKGMVTSINQADIEKINQDINEILALEEIRITRFCDVDNVKQIVFDKMGIPSDDSVGLEAASKEIYACMGLQVGDETSDFSSFYLDEIENVQRNYINNKQLSKYILALSQEHTCKTMIDTDTEQMIKWLQVEKYPMAKYPSRFSPTLMQQVAINIAISEKERNEKIFSVNGPPGTGKTTLLKEIIASNVVAMAEELIKYGEEGKSFTRHEIESSSGEYKDFYYEIPEEIAKYGILVVSNNNGAVENITLELPKAKSVRSDKTWTTHFERENHNEIYFTAVADNLLEGDEQAWGLISARMGKKKYVSKLLNTCIFKKKNDEPDKITLDVASESKVNWKQAVGEYNKAKNRVLMYRSQIKQDKDLLVQLYREREKLGRKQSELEQLLKEQTQVKAEMVTLEENICRNEKHTVDCEQEAMYIKKHANLIQKIMILFHMGVLGKQITSINTKKCELILEHEKMICERGIVAERVRKINQQVQKKYADIDSVSKKIEEIEERVYGKDNSLKEKYGKNLADREFYGDIKSNRQSQNACPWTFQEYDQAREELFYAALQLRKTFILDMPYIRRNLFVYESFNNGKYTYAERNEMFPHLFNALSVVVPVLSSTFASVGRFLKYADNQSLGMLIIDEAGQATPQSALGAIYRTKKAIVVGDPLQVEPVVKIPQVLIDILADSAGVPKSYKRMENSAQIFADNVNEFNGMIGERQVGCPLVVHRRCVEPMFSISNIISYDGRMFNETEYKEDEQSFLLNKSGWINVSGAEQGGGNHYVEEQGQVVCKLLGNALEKYKDLFGSDEIIYIISPFRTVAESMRKCIINHFGAMGYDREQLAQWTNQCVGTVHTFQGKDAREVLVVLGCSSQSEGAMNWVIKKANILNVACTRAKYRIAFIGNINDWKYRNYFRDFIPNLIEVI